MRRSMHDRLRVTADMGEGAIMIHDLKQIISGREPQGGEGVVYIQRARSGGAKSGYWLLTLLALRGRPFALWPMLIYTGYVAIVVSVLQRSGKWLREPEQLLVWNSLSVALNLVGVALFFLQTFRANNSYATWRDGRVFIGTFTSECRALAGYVAGGQIRSVLLSRRMLRWSAVLLQLTKLHLRDESGDITQLRPLLNEQEYMTLVNVPIAIRWVFLLQRIEQVWSDAMDNGKLSKVAHKALPLTLSNLRLTIGSLIRIASTPMPFAYLAHLRTFLVLWLSILPLLFVYALGYWAIAICFMIGKGEEALERLERCLLGSNSNSESVSR